MSPSVLSRVPSNADQASEIKRMFIVNEGRNSGFLMVRIRAVQCRGAQRMREASLGREVSAIAALPQLLLHGTFRKHSSSLLLQGLS